MLIEQSKSKKTSVVQNSVDRDHLSSIALSIAVPGKSDSALKHLRSIEAILDSQGSSFRSLVSACVAMQSECAISPRKLVNVVAEVAKRGSGYSWIMRTAKAVRFVLEYPRFQRIADSEIACILARVPSEHQEALRETGTLDGLDVFNATREEVRKKYDELKGGGRKKSKLEKTLSAINKAIEFLPGEAEYADILEKMEQVSALLEQAMKSERGGTH